MTCLACDDRHSTAVPTAEWLSAVPGGSYCYACGRDARWLPHWDALAPNEPRAAPQPFAPPVEFKPRPDVVPHCSKCFAIEAREWRWTAVGTFCDACWAANEARWAREDWQQPPEAFPQWCTQGAEEGESCGAPCIHPPTKPLAKGGRYLCGGGYCKGEF